MITDKLLEIGVESRRVLPWQQASPITCGGWKNY
jgi:hypothetical protein